jgi:ABC-type multidrug transport system ATPase subunit
MIDNHPISDINEIRKHIGVCAQFDILWDELTAEDHLRMFARLKGIPKV